MRKHCLNCDNQSGSELFCDECKATGINEPIVEGAYYEREDGQVVGPAKKFHHYPERWLVGGWGYDTFGDRRCVPNDKTNLTRRVYLVPTDPAEVVAELRHQQKIADDNLCYGYPGCEVDGWRQAADLVAEKLGAKS